MKNDLVSIVIATRNSGELLGNCLQSIKQQTHKSIEIIIVDSKSTDNTLELAKKYHCKVYIFVPKVKKGAFDASFKRNYGAKRAKGKYIYWLDADMELPRKLIEEAINICKQGADAIILPEDSFGIGIWARAKNLERRCYWGDNTVECPRFFKRSVWNAIGGLDESLGAGGDDLDIHQKVLEKGYSVGRTKNIVLHNEGDLKLGKLISKHFMYGRDTIKYFYKRPKAGIVSYFPLRPAYIRNFRLFLSRPLDAGAFVIMRTLENIAGVAGILYSFVNK
jgi:arabinofuranan 3-O-arabinosyltransferase